MTVNKHIKTGLAALLLLAGLSLPAFAQSASLKSLQEGAEDFSETLAMSLPFNSSLGLNWSDAWIGKLLPSVPPHFGVGASFGFTTMKLPVFKELAASLGYNLPFDSGRIFLPAYAAEARLGGLFLPFDIGFKIGYLPPVTLWGSGADINYFLVGADLRFPLIEGGVVLPALSAGIGVNYLEGGLGGSAGAARVIEYGTHSITLEKPGVELRWDSFSVDLKAQISKTILIVTPYLGLGGTYAWSSAGYSVDGNISYDGGGAPSQAQIDDIKAYLKSAGLPDADIDSGSLSSSIKRSAFSFRAFGGLSFNLAVFRLDLTGLYSFRDSNFGAGFGFRFQL